MTRLNSFIKAIKARPFVVGRMMARLVHIPYQLFQPNAFDSTALLPRAFKMPRATPSGTGRHPMVHGSRTPEMLAEFPRPYIPWTFSSKSPRSREELAAVRASSAIARGRGGSRAAVAKLARPYGTRTAVSISLHLPRPESRMRARSFGHVVSCRLPSCPVCGTFSLRSRAMAPDTVASKQVPQRVSGGCRALGPVRAPACLAVRFTLLRNTTPSLDVLSARLVLNSSRAIARCVLAGRGKISRANERSW